MNLAIIKATIQSYYYCPYIISLYKPTTTLQNIIQTPPLTFDLSSGHLKGEY